MLNSCAIAAMCSLINERWPVCGLWWVVHESHHMLRNTLMSLPCALMYLLVSFFLPCRCAGAGTVIFLCLCSSQALSCHSAHNAHDHCHWLALLITPYPFTSLQHWLSPGWMCNVPTFKVSINPKSITLTLFKNLELLSFLPFLHPGSCFCQNLSRSAAGCFASLPH